MRSAATRTTIACVCVCYLQMWHCVIWQSGNRKRRSTIYIFEIYELRFSIPDSGQPIRLSTRPQCWSIECICRRAIILPLCPSLVAQRTARHTNIWDEVSCIKQKWMWIIYCHLIFVRFKMHCTVLLRFFCLLGNSLQLRIMHFAIKLRRPFGLIDSASRKERGETSTAKWPTHVIFINK